MSILNKMTPENFEKLSNQFCELEMSSSEMLRRMIGVLFEKAVDEPHFAVVYATLCARLAEVTRAWPFIRSVKDLSSGRWSWVADLDVDTSRLIPLESSASIEEYLDTPENQLPDAIGVGQLQLQASDCFLKCDTLLCCYHADQRPGVVFAVLRAKSFVQDEKTQLFGSFLTKEEAQQDAMKKASFKRLLLNQCQEEFERNVRNSSGAVALEAAARDAKEKAKQDALETVRLAKAQDIQPKESPEELELGVWVMKLKRRMLGNVKFIGELFKQQLLKEKIMHECIKLLLGSLDESDIIPDDESVEAAAKLFFTIGKQLESPPSSKARLDAYCKRLGTFSRDTKRFAARTRFMLQDLLECRRNGWKERRAKDGPHKIGPSKNAALPKATQNMQRRDQERNIARERQRNALSQHQAVRSQSLGRGGASQDVRERYSPSTVRILVRENELNTKKSISEDHVYPSWGDDKVTNRARASLDEYTELRDSTEFTMSLDEIPVQKKGYKCVFELALKRILEGTNLQRSAALEVSKIMLDGKRIQDNELTILLLETLEFLPDLAIDSPRAISHAADLLALIIRLGVISAEWLTQDAGRKVGDSSCENVPERRQLFAELASRFDDPETSELFTHFTRAHEVLVD